MPSRATLAATVAVLAAVGVGCGTDECTPEARQAALSQDVRAVLAGALSQSAAIDQEVERAQQCGE